MPSARPFLQHRRDDRPEFPTRRRIDADRRLIQQQQPRPRQQRAGQAELLLHPAGKLPGQPFRERAKAGETQQPRDTLGAQCCGHRMQIGEQVEVLGDAQLLVQAEALRHVADCRMRRRGVGRHVVAEYGDATARSGAADPAIRRSSVVLPAPSGPTRPVIIPGSIVADNPSSATCDDAPRAPGNTWRSASMATIGSVIGCAGNRMVTGMPWRTASSGSSMRMRSR